MKSKSTNFLLAEHPVFNTVSAPLFLTLDAEHSGLLWQALFLNGCEVLSSINFPLYLILDENDKEFIPEKISSGPAKIIFGNLNDKEGLFRNINDKHFLENENNILFLADSIGYTHNDISKTLNLLNNNDDCLVLGRSLTESLCFAGFNTYPEFLEGKNMDYDQILIQSCKYNSLLYTIGNFIHVNSIEDFRLLYQELSKKESLSYCSQKMHELFTHLFIEYKDLLK